jgi:membrane-associated phospholipid phosphatase
MNSQQDLFITFTAKPVFHSKNLIMKHFLISPFSRPVFRVLFCLVFISSSFTACVKTEHIPLVLINDASRYPADVINKWIAMQVRLDRDAVGIANPYFGRYYSYAGVAAFEAIAPGTPFDRSISGLWNGITGLPKVEDDKKYYWPASENAALAAMNRSFFTTASVIDKAAIDSLENALNSLYLGTENPAVISRSDDFGKAVGAAVFSWSETDGYKHAQDPYTPPVAPGLWQPTPPAFAPALVPYWGNLRTIVYGSNDNTQPGPPTAYSEDPASPFFKMVKHVYDVSQTLTPDQTAQAFFWRDLPGVSTAGHWQNILLQVLVQTNSRLDKAAIAYALTGACFNDAAISAFKTKYIYNLVRPITYIRSVLGFPTWNSLLTTPNHPEYPSAHSVVSTATAGAFTMVFGDIGSFTDHTWDYLGFAPRTYSSFQAIGQDAGNSRVFAGIHYQPSVDTGFIQGEKVAANILGRLGSHSGKGD